MNKKGQTAMMSVIGLVVLIGVAIITMVFIGVMAGRTFETSQTHLSLIGNAETAENETVTVLNGTAVSSANSRWLTLVNVSANYTFAIQETGNYTFDAAAGTITLINNDHNNTDWNLTYTYRNASVFGQLNTGIGSSFQAFSDLGSFMPLIVLALVVILILSLIFGLLAFQQLRGGSGGGSVL